MPLNVKNVRNLGTKKDLKISAHSNKFRKVAVMLEAGGGALLEAEFEKQIGLDICNESFDSQRVNRVMINSNAEIFFHGNMAADENRSLHLKKGGDNTKPVCTLRAFSNLKRPHNTFSKNIGLKKGTYYLLVKGELGTCEVRTVSAAQSEVKTNTMHLKNTADEKVVKSESSLLQNKEFFRPAVIPADTTAIEFYLKDGYIADIQIWYVPEVEK